MRSVSILVLEVNGTAVTDTAATTNVTPGTAPCSTVASADYTCTISVTLPIGTDEVQLGTYDAANAGGNLISQQLYSASVLEGHANAFGSSATPITLDAAPGSIGVVGLSGPTGTYPSFTVNGTGSATFTVSVLDAHGTAFASQPGQPTITHAVASGTGASASVSGTTLTLTPPSSGTSTNVDVNADPAGSIDVSTTLTSSPSAGATSFTVASATGMFAGQYLVLDYETYSGSTLIEESAKITSVSGDTITVSAGLAHAHVSGANVRHYSDNLVPSTAPFTVTIAETLIAPVACCSGTGGSEALVFNTSLALQTGTLTSSGYYDAARFDSADILFVVDSDNYVIYRSQFTAGSGFASAATMNGLPSQIQNVTSNLGFDVSSAGTTAIGNTDGTSPEIDIYNEGSNTPSASFSSTSLSSSSWEIVNPYLNQAAQTLAVLDDSSGTAFGVAYSMGNINASGSGPNDEIVVTSQGGSGEQDITSGITSQYVPDSSPGIMTWDKGLQALMYVNAHSTTSNTVLEYPRNGTTGATLDTSPTSVGTVPGEPDFVSASRDGDYVAVFYFDTGGNGDIQIFHYSGTSWSATATITNSAFANFTSMHFLPSDDLVITVSTGGQAELYEYTASGSVQSGFTNPANILGDFSSSNDVVNDCAISY